MDNNNADKQDRIAILLAKLANVVRTNEQAAIVLRDSLDTADFAHYQATQRALSDAMHATTEAILALG